MTNEEMMRPCQPEGWGLKEPFDACDFNMDYFEVFRNESDCNYNVYFLSTKIATVDEYADSFPIYRQIITTIADALNPPIKVTQAVLKAMEKVPEAKFNVLEAGLLPKLFRKRVSCKTKKEGGIEWIYGKTYYYDSWVDGVEKELRIDYDYIQADCPLALQVLLGFTTEGVPKDD
jgi:hypothetical protein